MPRVGFEPTTTVFERAKTVHTLDRVATVIGRSWYYHVLFMDVRYEVLKITDSL
jgi:hypothetical protein